MAMEWDSETRRDLQMVTLRCIGRNVADNVVSRAAFVAKAIFNSLNLAHKVDKSDTGSTP